MGRSVLSRGHSAQSDQGARIVHWDANSDGEWSEEFDGAGLVVNLAGRSVNCRYHQANRKAILQSRVGSTNAVARAIANANNPPPLWLQSSTATIYSHRYDAPNDDLSGIIGGTEHHVPDTWRFSIDVAKAWEETAYKINLPNTRIALLRSAMVMSPDRGGVFDVLTQMVHLGLGGHQWRRSPVRLMDSRK